MAFFRNLFANATGVWIFGALGRRAPPVRFPIDFNKAEPFVAYMAPPEYEQWKAFKNGAKQTE